MSKYAKNTIFTHSDSDFNTNITYEFNNISQATDHRI